MKFKIGDKVKSISNNYSDSKCKNKLGKIVEIDYDFPRPYCVEFFEHVNGHNGRENRKGKDGYCWYLTENQLELHKKDNKQKFKIGDIIRCISNYSMYKPYKNKIGRIIDIGGNSLEPYLIEFFEPVKYGHSGFEKGKDDYCRWFEKKEIESCEENPKIVEFLKKKKKKIKIDEFNLACYKIYWKSGGRSIASIYLDKDGNKWLAPCNWTGPGLLQKCIHRIKKIKKLGIVK